MIETEAWLLPSDQHDSEASFVSHHPSVRFCSICQRNGFDHRTDLLQGAKGKRVLGKFLRETLLFRSARNGRDSKTHASRKLNSEVAKPTNALNSDELAGSSL